MRSTLLVLLLCAILGAARNRVEGRPFLQDEGVSGIIMESHNSEILDTGLGNYLHGRMANTSRSHGSQASFVTFPHRDDAFSTDGKVKKFALMEISSENMELIPSRRLKRQEEGEEQDLSYLPNNPRNEFLAVNSSSDDSSHDSLLVNTLKNSLGLNLIRNSSSDVHIKSSVQNDSSEQHLNPHSVTMHPVIVFANSSSFDEHDYTSEDTSEENSSLSEMSYSFETSQSAKNSTSLSARSNIISESKERSKDTCIESRHSKDSYRDKINGRLPPNVIEVIDKPEKNHVYKENAQNISNKTTSNIFTVITKNLMGMMTFNGSSKLNNTISNISSNNCMKYFKPAEAMNFTQPLSDAGQASQVNGSNITSDGIFTYIFTMMEHSCDNLDESSSENSSDTSSQETLPETSPTTFLDTERGILDVTVSGMEHSSAASFSTASTHVDVIQHISLNSTGRRSFSTTNTSDGNLHDDMNIAGEQISSEMSVNVTHGGSSKTTSSIWKILTANVLGMIPDKATPMKNEKKHEEKIEEESLKPHDHSVKISVSTDAEGKWKKSTLKETVEVPMSRSALFIDEPELLVHTADNKRNVKDTEDARYSSFDSVPNVSRDKHEILFQLNNSPNYDANVPGHSTLQANSSKNWKSEKKSLNFSFNDVAEPQKNVSNSTKTSDVSENLYKGFSLQLTPFTENGMSNTSVLFQGSANNTQNETGQHAIDLSFEISDFVMRAHSSPNVSEPTKKSETTHEGSVSSNESGPLYIQKNPLAPILAFSYGKPFIMPAQSLLENGSLSEWNKQIPVDELSISSVDSCNDSGTEFADESSPVLIVIEPEKEQSEKVVLIVPDMPRKMFSDDWSQTETNPENMDSKQVGDSQHKKSENIVNNIKYDLPLSITSTMKSLTTASHIIPKAELISKKSGNAPEMENLTLITYFFGDSDNENSSISKEIPGDTLLVIVDSYEDIPLNLPDINQNSSPSSTKSYQLPSSRKYENASQSDAAKGKSISSADVEDSVNLHLKTRKKMDRSESDKFSGRKTMPNTDGILTQNNFPIDLKNTKISEVELAKMHNIANSMGAQNTKCGNSHPNCEKMSSNIMNEVVSFTTIKDNQKFRYDMIPTEFATLTTITFREESRGQTDAPQSVPYKPGFKEEDSVLVGLGKAPEKRISNSPIAFTVPGKMDEKTQSLMTLLLDENDLYSRLPVPLKSPPLDEFRPWLKEHTFVDGREQPEENHQFS